MKDKYMPALAALLSAAVLGAQLPAAAAKTVPADTPEIQYFGRWDGEAGVERCGYGAAYLRANFTGTGLKADLRGEGIYWRVSIDGGEFRRLLPDGSEVVLAERLAPGAHRVLLVRSTEGEAGISEFRGFELSEGGELLPPDPPKKRRLEFVGDSVTAGAESEGPWGQEWETARFPVDAVLIAIGTNDFSRDGLLAVPPSGREFRRGYRALIETVREKNPGKPIICLDPITGLQEPEATARVIGWIRETVGSLNRQGDAEVYFIPLNENGSLLRPEDLAGENGHPLKDGSAKVAAYLKDKVAAILGW